MNKKYIKKLICVSFILILCFNLYTSTAYAEFPPLTPMGRRIGSFIQAGLLALNIALTSTVSASQGADIINFLGDPLDVNYSYTEMWEDRPVIQIWDDYVTIDGVHYTDIWISNEAAQKFRTDGFDFATAYEIASNSNGTLAAGKGYWDGIPIFQTNTGLWSQTYTIPNSPGTYSMGNSRLIVTQTSPTNNNVKYQLSNGWETSLYSFNPQTASREGYANIITPNYQPRVRKLGPEGVNPSTVNVGGHGINYIETNFDFDYVSRTIPAEEVMPSDNGLMIRLPYDTTGLHDFVVDNPDWGNGVTVDPSNVLIMDKLDDLIDIIAPIIPILNFGDTFYTTNHEQPIPPIQDTLLPDTWWSQVSQKLDQVIQTIQSIPSQIPSYNTILQTIQQSISSINDKLGDLVDDIIQGIEEGPIKLVDKVIDALKNVFASILATLASALGIWHYVVEWIASISAPFTFIFGIMQGTSYNMVLPIYALIAGTIVIAVYRRFGQ